jgi:two-component sensor histidine kinase
MAIHDLASNAAKYGPLSAVSGRLEVRWTITGGTDNEILALSWAERRPGGQGADTARVRNDADRTRLDP